MSDLFMHLGVSYSVSQEGDKLVFDPAPNRWRPTRTPKATQDQLGKAYARFLKRREAALIAHTYRVLKPSYNHRTSTGE